MSVDNTPEEKVSAPKQCRNLLKGESQYIECDSLKQANNVVKRLYLVERLPKEMNNFKFDCETFTAIARVSDKIVFIVKVTRIK